MIYLEIAIDPESFEDLKDLGLLEKLFGFEHGRLVALLPAKGKNGIQEEKNWKLLVKQHLTRLLPGKSKEIELRLDRIMDRCVWRSRGKSKHGPVQPWRSLARDEHEQREFAAILCSEAGLCCHPEYSYQGMHFPPEAYPDFLRAPIHVADSLKSPDVFLENLRPLITSAKRITFIHDQRTDVSLLPLELAKKRLIDFDCQNPSLFELDARESFKGTR